MAYDERLADVMRDDLAEEAGITERKMFGGLCFMSAGHMVCGVHASGAMYRVGKSRETEARAIPGTGPMTFTGRPMGGMVEADEDLLADDALRGKLLALALAHARNLPPK